MKSSKKESALDRRLRELYEQADALERDIKSMEKTAHKFGTPDEEARIRAATAAARRVEMSRLNPNYAASVGTGTTTSISVTKPDGYAAGENEAEANIFNVADGGGGGAQCDAFTSTQSEPAMITPLYRRVAAPPKTQKIANYLASGSFGGKVPLNHERKAQRFRAILALVAVATFAWIIYRSMLR